MKKPALGLPRRQLEGERLLAAALSVPNGERVSDDDLPVGGML